MPDQASSEECARRQRFDAVRRAYAAAGTDSDYEHITAAWDQAAEALSIA